MEQVLTGLKVLDFSRFIAGPYATQLLADFGAEVIRVEKLGGGDDRTQGPFTADGFTVPMSALIGRNKKAITLNWNNPEGQELLEQLVKTCDVVLHNFSPGSKPAHTLSYDSLKSVNPAIIVVAISAFGQSGPYQRRPGFDPLAQFMSGGPSYTGFPGNPPVRSQVNYVDHGTGVSAALGTMLALHHRTRTGVGQMVDVALFDTAVCFVATPAAAEYKLLRLAREQMGNQAFWGSPANTYQTKNGMVVVAAATNSLWQNLLTIIEKEVDVTAPELSDVKSRYLHRDVTDRFVGEWMAKHTVEEVINLLEQAHVPCGPVNTVPEMLNDPQVKARELIVEVDQPGIGPVPQAGVQIKLSLTPGSIRTRAPDVGEHNEEVYGALLGLKPKELAILKKQGVI